MRLDGKTALVTGGARRVGRCIAEALAAKRVNLAIHCRNSVREAKETALELSQRFGIRAEVFQARLDRVEDIQKMSGAVLRAFKTVHILINSASVYEKNEFGRTTQQDWNKHLDANLRAPFFLSQSLAPAMKRAGQGRIINIADWSGMRPYTDYIPYCVSKAGLLCLNTALAKALAPGIQVNAIMPGPVLLPESFSKKQTRAVVQATLVKRLGSPQDIAKAVIFLLEQGDFITGAALPVDGGRLIA